MAAGKAVVSTTVGAEGLDINNGRNIVLADEPSHFAATVVDLLRDRGCRERIGNAASKHAAQFDWQVVAEKFSQILEQVRQTSRASLAA
jgi:glycosyltransferase involved in cell wall biosynthesis